MSTVLITGATDGLGRATAEALHAQGHTLLLHGRDAAKLAAVAPLGETYRADLASLADVRRLAAEVRAQHDDLDVLINNAGVGRGPQGRPESDDGIELRFAVNHLAPFLLTLELLPILRRRIVNVASLAQTPIDFDDPLLEHGHDPSRAYAQSKLAQVTFTVELAARLAGVNPTVTALHPGTHMPTKLVFEEGGEEEDSLQTGVDATVRAAVGPEVDGVSGVFFDRQREAHADAQAYDPEARRRLWELSLSLADVEDPTSAPTQRHDHR